MRGCSSLKHKQNKRRGRKGRGEEFGFRTSVSLYQGESCVTVTDGTQP